MKIKNPSLFLYAGIPQKTPRYIQQDSVAQVMLYMFSLPKGRGAFSGRLFFVLFSSIVLPPRTAEHHLVCCFCSSSFLLKFFPIQPGRPSQLPTGQTPGAPSAPGQRMRFPPAIKFSFRNLQQNPRRPPPGARWLFSCSHKIYMTRHGLIWFQSVEVAFPVYFANRALQASFQKQKQKQHQQDCCLHFTIS